MKKWILAIITTLILSGGAFYLFLNYTGNNLDQFLTQKSNDCKVVKYKLGNINDLEYSRKQIKQIIQKAERLWEKETPKDIFKYNPQAEFTINISNKLQKKPETLPQIKQNYTELQQKREQLKNNYNTKSKKYNKEVEQHQRQAQQYRKQAQKINQQDNPSDKKVKQLKQKKRRVESRKAELNQKKKSLESIVDKITSTSKQLAELSSKFGETTTYKQVYSTTTAFKQNNFSSKEINIEKFYDHDDLVLKIAHYLGHAYGLEYIDNSQAIMAPKLDQQTLSTLQLTSEDIKAIEEKCQ